MRIYRVLRWVTCGILFYETQAIIIEHEKLPTLSRLANRHKWICPGLLIALAWHLIVMQPEPECDVVP